MAESDCCGCRKPTLMLEKDMYDSWKTRIWLYIKRKENGEMLIDSIVKGPFKLKEEITIPGVNGVADDKRAQTPFSNCKRNMGSGQRIDGRHGADTSRTGMSMKNIQVNMKFINHLQPEWSRFVIAAKQAKICIQ
nr:hypothetical protein [Tanacetum cinerariifolium]